MVEEQLWLDFKRIDYAKTASRVLNFFNYEYPRLARIYDAANPDQLKSPALSSMPKGGAQSPDDKLIKYLYAKAVCDGVEQAYHKGSELLKYVLDDVRGKMTADLTMERLHVERTRYYELKMQALLEFADIFEVQNLACPDLHVYID